MVYRYQEWQDGIHNFDNHMMLSLHLCLTLRNALQTHTAVSRVIGIIEATEGESFPNKEKVLQAYLSFEALSEHDYTYACVSCGYHPATVVMDLHKKGVFSMPGDGKNPFIVRPSYQNWAPWIGQHTRQSDIVFNTEYAKIHVPDVSTDADERVTEERLADEVLNLKRDILHLYNVDRNNKVKEQFKTIVGSNTAFSLDVNGRITLGHQSKETTTPQLTLHTVKAHQSCWGQKLTQTQENMVLDSRGSPDERLAYLNNQILTRTDFWTLGRPQDVEGMILNSCLKVIENLANHQVVKLHTFSNINVSPSVYNLFWTEITTVLQGIKVFLANSYVVHTWFIPSVQNPEQHLPDKADDFQWILVPVWRPGHWTICLLANLFGIIPLLVVLQFCSVQKQVALLVSPGPWREFCANDIQGIPRQRACGVFVLMYALYFVMESAFDFSELDMEHLRRWWCMLLIDNFPVTFEGRRSTKRRLEREDCEDSPRKKDPLAKTAAEILVSSEEEDGEKHPFISSAMAASQWCSAKNMGDKVILPQILSMAPLDREAALLNLGEASNLRDEDSWEDRMDPFMFRFKFESDYLMFFEQYIDKENLKVHTCFEERG
ncbi:uncharacterized protein LOC117553203 isoform X4 [Gymnodraco acuticeps]|uniref:Uncharacterized protein LOC117553203 isoform X4 n=1 Tax=Gymnodraco acuticeps TaxID=8218 RepID=A0A6P8V7C8_GYMAC|nr:uncharacterized protein LOC117553203 isoform X4 [Gymnodraco acuticeps]